MRTSSSLPRTKSATLSWPTPPTSAIPPPPIIPHPCNGPINPMTQRIPRCPGSRGLPPPIPPSGGEAPPASRGWRLRAGEYGAAKRGWRYKSERSGPPSRRRRCTALRRQGSEHAQRGELSQRDWLARWMSRLPVSDAMGPVTEENTAAGDEEKGGPMGGEGDVGS